MMPIMAARPLLRSALSLNSLTMGVGVAHPRDAVADNIARLKVGVLGEERVVEDGDNGNNLRPAGLRQSSPRAEGASGDVLELEGREGQVRAVARPLVASAGDEDVEGGKHGNAAVLDLHLLPAAVLLRHLGHQ